VVNAVVRGRELEVYWSQILFRLPQSALRAVTSISASG